MNTNSSQKYNFICISSFVLGIASLILSSAVNGALAGNTLNILIYSITISILGIVLAFVGRINTKKTNTKGNGLALTGFILNLTMLGGGVIYTIFDHLGKPERFGINKATDQKMLKLIISNFIILAICTVISVVYGIIAKKNK